MLNHDYWVYMLTNKHCSTLYIGITNNINRRKYQHRNGEAGGFAKRYHLHRLVRVEHFRNVNDAIACEKKLKGWRRSRKIALIKETNHDGLISVMTGSNNQRFMIGRGRRRR